MIILKYWNPQLKIGLEDYRDAWQFHQKINIHTEVHEDTGIPSFPKKQLCLSIKLISKFKGKTDVGKN